MNNQLGSKELVDHVHSQIGVLEVEEHREGDQDAHAHPNLSPPRCRSLRVEPLNSLAHLQANHIGEHGGNNEQQGEVARGLIVEKNADEEEEGVSHENASAIHLTVLLAPRANESQHKHHHGQKGPEEELGEEQRVLVVEGKDVLSHVDQEVGSRGVGGHVYRIGSHGTLGIGQVAQRVSVHWLCRHLAECRN